MTDEHIEGSNTAREHAGEAVRDVRGWPGYGGVMGGVVLIALCVLAAGYGYEGWAWISGLAGAVVLILGIVAVVAVNRRNH
ncbi:hypothetical protein ACWDUM_21200 [Rhodococcus sp. NPDC003322]